eukprot:392859-Prymnesium_polylepis.3
MRHQPCQPGAAAHVRPLRDLACAHAHPVWLSRAGHLNRRVPPTRAARHLVMAHSNLSPMKCSKVLDHEAMRQRDWDLDRALLGLRG